VSRRHLKVRVDGELFLFSSSFYSLLHYTLEIPCNLSSGWLCFLSCIRICVCLSRVSCFLLPYSGQGSGYICFPRPRFFFSLYLLILFPFGLLSVYLLFHLSAEGFLAVLLIRLLTLGVASRTCPSRKKSNLRCQDCRLVWRGIGLWRGLYDLPDSAFIDNLLRFKHSSSFFFFLLGILSSSFAHRFCYFFFFLSFSHEPWHCITLVFSLALLPRICPLLSIRSYLLNPSAVPMPSG